MEWREEIYEEFYTHVTVFMLIEQDVPHAALDNMLIR